MAVDITWSDSDGGSAITQPVDHGSGANGDTLTYQEIFLRHSANQQISSCKFFLFGGDSQEILYWGSELYEANKFGGFQINMDAINSYAGDWPSLDYKNPDQSRTFYAGAGDNAQNGITLVKQMSGGMIQDGVIPADCSPDPSFRARIQIPTDEEETGTRSFSLKLRFTYTS